MAAIIMKRLLARGLLLDNPLLLLLLSFCQGKDRMSQKMLRCIES